MIGGVRPDEFTPRQVKDHQPVQQLEACRWHHKQIDCRDGIFMVVYERPPALPAGPVAPPKIFAYCGLGHIKTKDKTGVGIVRLNRLELGGRVS